MEGAGTMLWGFGAVGAATVVGVLARTTATSSLKTQLSAERRRSAAALEEAAADLSALQRQVAAQRGEARRQRAAVEQQLQQARARVLVLESMLSERSQKHAVGGAGRSWGAHCC
jgi:hypothetical protein